MDCDLRLLLHWHNAIHLILLLLGVTSATILAPRVAVDDVTSDTEIIFAVLLCLVALQVGIFATYYRANADLGKMINLDIKQHFYLRCVIAGVVGALYICEGSFLLTLATTDAILPLELASGVVALTAGVVALAECVASWRSVAAFDAVQTSTSRYACPTPWLLCCCLATPSSSVGHVGQTTDLPRGGTHLT